MTSGLDLIVGLLFGAGIAWLWRWEARRHRTHVLRHPKLLLLASAGMLPFLWFAIIAMKRSVVAWSDVGVPLSFASIGAYLLLEYLTVRYVVKPDGFEYRTLAAGAGIAFWADIRSVRWSLVGSWFRVELQSGSVVRVSVIILGIPTLAQALLDHAGQTVDPSARPVLEQTAAGNPPVPWG